MPFSHKNIFYVVLSCILLVSLHGFAQGKKVSPVVDSLNIVLKTAKHDTTRAAAYVELSANLYIEYPDTLIPLCRKAIALLDKLPASLQKNRTVLIIKSGALNNMGFMLGQQGQQKEALVCHEQSLALDEQLGDRKGLASSLANLATIYQNFGQTKKALEYFTRALKLHEEFQNKPGIAKALVNIGNIFFNQGQLADALGYYEKATVMFKAINDKNSLGTVTNNIGAVYSKQEDIDKALEYYLMGLQYREEANSKFGVAHSLSNIGNAYKAKRQWAEAKDYLMRSLKIREEIKDRPGISISLQAIGEMYRCMNRFTEAEPYLQRSLAIAQEDGFAITIRDASQTLSKVYKAQKKHERALEMYELYVQMRDSLSNTETKKAALKTQLSYEYEKKAATDSVVHVKEKQVSATLLEKQKAETRSARNKQYYLAGGLALLLVFAAFIFNRFRVTQKQKKIIELQKHIVEEKQKEILDSIHYAKRIQRALITNERYIANKLNSLRRNLK